ncbi:hypothetical protein [Aquibacillus salsiterrae]|uniref:Uncharacterized protein n=1 Tax=Aquibacillus salsiterrae TaxID=2950439 RepID=A0A9X4AEV7_9BACI|nr:hypothetical protein [Aquibacillus salsiterrae]MDC3417352.1 hypothetical protein [Aquibacillus salsiterrae]
MIESCFYCGSHVIEGALHQINFFHNDVDREEMLCPECYKDWLEGIKE